MKGNIGRSQSLAMEATRSVLVHLELGKFVSQYDWVQSYERQIPKNALCETRIDFRTNTGIRGRTNCTPIEESVHAPSLHGVEKVFVLLETDFSDCGPRHFDCSVTEDGLVVHEIDKFPF